MRLLLIMLIIGMIAFLLLTACNGKPDYIQGESSYEIKYFIDLRTGLCFAERGWGNGNSFTCVPCDSMKRLDKYLNHERDK